MSETKITNVGELRGKTAAGLAEHIGKAPADATVRVIRRLEVGHVLHQGDEYLHRVADDHPRGRLLQRGGRFVIGGGGDHVVEGDGIEVYEGVQLPHWVALPEGASEADLLGPLVVVPAAARWRHRTHAGYEISQAGVYQTTHQFDPSTKRRVID